MLNNWVVGLLVVVVLLSLYFVIVSGSIMKGIANRVDDNIDSINSRLKGISDYYLMRVRMLEDEMLEREQEDATDFEKRLVYLEGKIVGMEAAAIKEIFDGMASISALFAEPEKTPEPEQETFSFGQAIERAMAGQVVRRKLWPSGAYIAKAGGHLDIVTVNTTMFYTPLPDDLVANDWEAA